MPISHYIKIYSCPDDADHLILFSTRRMTKIRLSRGLWAQMHNGTLPAPQQARLRDLGRMGGGP